MNIRSCASVITLGIGVLRLTTALYYGPSGRSVQRTGVEPDIELVAAPVATAERRGRREADRPHALPGPLRAERPGNCIRTGTR